MTHGYSLGIIMIVLTVQIVAEKVCEIFSNSYSKQAMQ